MKSIRGQVAVIVESSTQKLLLVFWDCVNCKRTDLASEELPTSYTVIPIPVQAVVAAVYEFVELSTHKDFKYILLVATS